MDEAWLDDHSVGGGNGSGTVAAQSFPLSRRSSEKRNVTVKTARNGASGVNGGAGRSRVPLVFKAAQGVAPLEFPG